MYLVKSLNAYFGTNAERVAAGLSSFLAGDEFNETDTGNVYQHNGMAWIKTAVDGSGYLPLSGGTLTGGLVVNSSEGDNDFRIAGNGVTNGVFYDGGNSRLGVNTIPSAALHVIEDSGTVAIFEENASGEVGINSFYNPNTTNNNGSLIRFDTDTTGTGATARSQIAQIGTVFTVHNHATRTGNIVFRNYQNGSFGTRLTISSNVLIEGTTGALILSRLTTTQQNALTGVNGMIIYNTSTNKVRAYAGGAWVDLH